MCQHTSACVSMRQHTSAYVSRRQHTSADVSRRQHASGYLAERRAPGTDERLGGDEERHIRHSVLCDPTPAHPLGAGEFATRFHRLRLVYVRGLELLVYEPLSY
jgi:hypothetical protein